MAGIRWTQVEIPLGGVDQYTDAPHVIDAGKMLELENVRFRNPPAMGKRFGFEALSATTLDSVTLTEPARLIGWGDTTLLATGEKLYSYSEKADKWSDRGWLSDCHLDRVGIANEFTISIDHGTVLEVNGLIFHAWTGTYQQTNVVVIDQATGTVIERYSLASAAKPKLLAIGTNAYLFGETNAGTGIAYYKQDTTTAPYRFTTATGTLATVGTPRFDRTTFDVDTDGTHFYVAYDVAGATAINIDKFDTAFSYVTQAVITVDTPYSIAVLGKAGSDGIFVGYSDSASGHNVKTYPYALNTLTATRQLSTTAGAAGDRIGLCPRETSSLACVVFREPASGTRRAHMKYSWLNHNGTWGGNTSFYDLEPFSEPIKRASTGNIYVVCGFKSDTQGTAYLVELYNAGTATGRWVGTIARGVHGAITNTTGYMPQMVESADVNKLHVMQPIKSSYDFARDDDETIILARTGLDRCTFDFSRDKLHATAPWGEGLFFAGARPGWYDGKLVTEHGFAYSPEYKTSAVAAGGSLEASGAHIITQIYEHEDNNGYSVKSTPSPPFTQSTDATNKIINITQDQDLLLTARSGAGAANPVTRVQTYRTLKDGTVPLYRAQQSPNGASPTYAAAESLGGTDEADSEIIYHEVLYTTGDILDNVNSAPACKYTCIHNDRIWLGGTEDPTWVWFSQPFVEGEQPRFNEALRINVGDAVTAVASLDSTMIAFSLGGIYGIHGDGPPATGGIELGFVVNRITSDVGCIDWRSVARVPNGLMFLSSKGFYLLGRDMSVTWVGAPVKSYLATYYTCVGAVVTEDSHEAIFCMQGADQLSARLVYNYALDRWSLDTLPLDEFNTSCASLRNPTYTPRLFSYVTTDAVVKRTTPSAYDEGTAGSAFIATKIVTPWIRLNTLQGWQRIRKLLLLLDSAYTATGGLRVEVGFNYATTYAETHTWTAAQMVEIAPTNLEVHLAKQTCEAVRFRITDFADVDDTPSAGHVVRSLVLEAGIRPARTMQLADGTERK